MRTDNILGLVYTNVHDELIPEYTDLRSMASIPFAGRYRLVDFSISNLTNAGVTNVALLTKKNYKSLMDHLGSGKDFDLDRKNGGLVIFPPYSTADSEKIYKGHLDALSGIIQFLSDAREEYVVICDSDVVSNISISEMLKEHIENGADITVAYKNGKLPCNHNDIMCFDFEKGTGRIKKIFFKDSADNADYSLDIVIAKRKFLIDFVQKSVPQGHTSMSRDLFCGNENKFKIFGFKVEGFAEVLDSMDSYFRTNMLLLDKSNREKLFLEERPVYTRTYDSMPTRYGIASSVKNSLVADGCIIEGHIKNCIIFRGVTVEAGARIENSIIMKNSVIKKGSDIRYAIIDKNTVIKEDEVIKGNKQKIMYKEKLK